MRIKYTTKLTDKQIELAYQQYLDGISIQILAEQFGVSDKTIYRAFDKLKKGKMFKWKKRTTI